MAKRTRRKAAPVTPLPPPEGGAPGPRQWPSHRIETWPIGRPKPYANNTRKHTPAQIEQIRASLREFGWTMPILVLERSLLLTGWVQPILITREGVIIDGFHRTRLAIESAVLKKRDAGKVPCAIIDVPRDKAMILTIRMNRAKGSHVAVRMSEIVRELIDSPSLRSAGSGDRGSARPRMRSTCCIRTASSR
jgi:ParB-like chromosome segregation protein Spo0J